MGWRFGESVFGSGLVEGFLTLTNSPFWSDVLGYGFGMIHLPGISYYDFDSGALSSMLDRLAYRPNFGGREKIFRYPVLDETLLPELVLAIRMPTNFPRLNIIQLLETVVPRYPSLQEWRRLL